MYACVFVNFCTCILAVSIANNIMNDGKSGDESVNRRDPIYTYHDGAEEVV